MNKCIICQTEEDTFEEHHGACVQHYCKQCIVDVINGRSAMSCKCLCGAEYTNELMQWAGINLLTRKRNALLRKMWDVHISHYMIDIIYVAAEALTFMYVYQIIAFFYYCISERDWVLFVILLPLLISSFKGTVPKIANFFKYDYTLMKARIVYLIEEYCLDEAQLKFLKSVHILLIILSITLHFSLTLLLFLYYIS